MADTRWIISIEGFPKPIELNQNPSSKGTLLNKNISYRDTVDDGEVRVAPFKDASSGVTLDWKVCNLELRELLYYVAKKDLKVSIVSHYKDSKITPIGGIEGIHGLAGWEGNFDEYKEDELKEYTRPHYSISITMQRVRDLSEDEIRGIIDLFNSSQ